jgi:hypothetical protein
MQLQWYEAAMSHRVSLGHTQVVGVGPCSSMSTDPLHWLTDKGSTCAGTCFALGQLRQQSCTSLAADCVGGPALL